MKIIGVIPARFKSTRFEGKPLADICGKPMIWWVYNQVKKVKSLSALFVATDDQRIVDTCQKHNLKYVLTRNNHPDHISRVQEVSDKVSADYYICVNGDEPLIVPEAIETVIKSLTEKGVFFRGAMRDLIDPAETLDFSNIKLAISNNGRCIFMSRSAIPYPKGTLSFKYKKYVGIECFTKQALDFFVNTPMGMLEKIEDIDHLRFIENDIPLFFTPVNSESIAVDTPKDLLHVCDVIKKQINQGIIKI